MHKTAVEKANNCDYDAINSWLKRSKACINWVVGSWPLLVYWVYCWCLSYPPLALSSLSLHLGDSVFYACGIDGRTRFTLMSHCTHFLDPPTYSLSLVLTFFVCNLGARLDYIIFTVAFFKANHGKLKFFSATDHQPMRITAIRWHFTFHFF